MDRGGEQPRCGVSLRSAKRTSYANATEGEMQLQRNDPPREFQVGAPPQITIRDCGRIALEADEQVTFTTEAGGEYDVARKSWGFYATPSANGRLAKFNLRTALVINAAGMLYVMLVESGCEQDFQEYLDHDGQRVITWLDTDAAVERLSQLVDGEGANLGRN